jgi:hypothetical protein
MKKFGNIALFVVLVVASAVTTFWLVNRNNVPYASPEELLQQQRLAEIPGDTAEEKFHYILGQVTKDVEDKASEYRKQRSILPQLAAEANMQTPDYIRQNNELMKATEPKLRAAMADVMGVFDKAQDDVDLLIGGQSEETVTKINDEWKKLKEEQTVLYIDFFSFEEDILQTYVEMLAFFAEKADTTTFNEAEAKLNFADPADQEAAEKLRQRIIDLSEEQKEILRQG